MFAGNGHGNQGERQAMFHVKPWQSCSGFVIETTQVPGGWEEPALWTLPGPIHTKLVW